MKNYLLLSLFIMTACGSAENLPTIDIPEITPTPTVTATVVTQAAATSEKVAIEKSAIAEPTAEPTTEPTAEPTIAATRVATSAITATPTPTPIQIAIATVAPTATPTSAPTATPTPFVIPVFPGNASLASTLPTNQCQSWNIGGYTPYDYYVMGVDTSASTDMKWHNLGTVSYSPASTAQQNQTTYTNGVNSIENAHPGYDFLIITIYNAGFGQQCWWKN